MAVDAACFKQYLKLPPDSSENVEIFLDAARAKAKAAGIPELQNNALYDLFIYSLAAMYYENRGMSFSGSYQATAEANARRLINSFVLELRHASEENAAEEGDGVE